MTGAHGPAPAAAPAAAGSPARARLRKLLTARVIGFTILGAAAAFVLAAVIGYLATGEERAYTGPATVTRAHWRKICSVDVTFPDGSAHKYSFDTSRGHCDSLTPGTALIIDHGTIVNTPGKDKP